MAVNNNGHLEKRLWSAADELRANSKLKSSEYSVPVLGLIFLRYADHKFTRAQAKLTGKSGGRRTIGKTVKGGFTWARSSSPLPSHQSKTGMRPCNRRGACSGCGYAR